ncbi:MAG: sulfotransferase [Bacteroidota bacterium]
MISESELIFIVSQPRAGSTFLQKVLATNPAIATSGEPWVLLKYANFLKPGLVKTPFETKLTTEAFDKFLINAGYSSNEFISTILKDQILKLYDKKRGTRKYFLDKTPRYYEILPELISLFPKSKIIILKRNPLDILTSIVKSWNKTTLSLLVDHYRDICIAPGLLQSFLEEHPLQNVREISYESLIDDPMNLIKDLSIWLGIETNLNSFNEYSSVELDTKFGDQVGSEKYFGVADGSVNAWEDLYNANSYWRNFFKGYINELGVDFLVKYGYEYTISAQSTAAFSNFKRYHFLNYNTNPLTKPKSWIPFLRLKFLELTQKSLIGKAPSISR